MTDPAPLENPVPQLFLGEWTVLAKKRKDKDLDSAVEIKSIRITMDSPAESPVQYKVELLGPAAGTEVSPPHHSYKCHLDEDSETLCYNAPEKGESGCISYWRNQAFDTIFALQEDDKGETTRVWTACRKPSRTSPSSQDFVKEVVDDTWKVKLTDGFHAAKPGCIRIRSFDETSSSGSVNTQFAESGLYGLYHSHNETGPFVLYDVMAYDNRVKSFNSVFGVRSLNYWNRTVGKRVGKRIFATFNNKFSIPSTHFLSHDGGDGIQNRIGSLMPFEKEQLSQKLLDLLHGLDDLLPESDKAGGSADLSGIRELVAQLKHVESETNDPDDPDIGIWVGVPTSP